MEFYSSWLLPCLYLSVLRLGCWAQAPGDFDPTCRAGQNVDAHVFPESWELLLDSYDYSNLYDTTASSSTPVWVATNEDGDGSNLNMGFNWDQLFGGACTVNIRACTNANPPQDNWLFTQYISYNASVEVFLNVSYDFRTCVSNCLPYITLYRYNTDGIQPRSVVTNTANYQPLFGSEENSRVPPDSASQLNGAQTRSLPRPTGQAGFYLAFRDQGTCGMLERIILYYRVVRGFSQPFISCPDVPLPLTGSGTTSSLECTCMEGTSGVGSLERTCDEQGMCSEGQRCECSPGLQFISTSGSCTMCVAGTYKDQISNDSCLACPELSEARDPGATICECIPPNSRAGSDGAEVACRDRRLSTSAAVAITFFVTFLVVGVVFFLLGGVVTYLCRQRIEKVI